MNSEVQRANYGHYGVVELLQAEGSLTKIRTDNDTEFWVKTEKLKAIKPKRVKRAAPTAPPALDESADAWSKFVAYLESTGYWLEVHTRAAGIAGVEAEYVNWSGESLPDDAVHVYEKRPVERCWRLFFKLVDGVPAPFPIDLAGTTGKHPTNNPRGLWRPTGRVEVYFATIIEQLVRAGLRASVYADGELLSRLDLHPATIQ